MRGPAFASFLRQRVVCQRSGIVKSWRLLSSTRSHDWAQALPCRRSIALNFDSNSHRIKKWFNIARNKGEGSDSTGCDVEGECENDRSAPGAGLTVVVGLSGGVDSAVAALLLLQQGCNVVGAFMKNWDKTDEDDDACTAEVDLEDAMAVGKCLGIPVVEVNLAREYWTDVFIPSLEELTKGRTPNQDVMCNRHIKFSAFYDHAIDLMGADFVATGHYARISPGPGDDWTKPLLQAGVDKKKDQSYFLSSVPSSVFSKVIFPLGDMLKTEVRDLALSAELPVAAKRESMGVCFIGKRRRWSDFLKGYLAPTEGNFICVETGKCMGKHMGFELYTIGQGASISGTSEKMFVTLVHPPTSCVLVAPGTGHPSLFSGGLAVRFEDFHWVAGSPPAELQGDGEEGEPEGKGQLQCMFRIRHGEELASCSVQLSRDHRIFEGNGYDDLDWLQTRHSEEGDGTSYDEGGLVLQMEFEPVRAVAPGQVVALYERDVCLGSGVILRAEAPLQPLLFAPHENFWPDWQPTKENLDNESQNKNHALRRQKSRYWKTK